MPEFSVAVVPGRQSQKMLLRNKTLSATSVNKGCHSHQWLQPPLTPVTPEGTPEGNKEDLPCSSHHTAATLMVRPQDVKAQDTGPGGWRCVSKEWYQWAQALHLPKQKNAKFLEKSGFLWFDFVTATCPLLQNYIYPSFRHLLQAVFSGLLEMLPPRFRA